MDSGFDAHIVHPQSWTATPRRCGADGSNEQPLSEHGFALGLSHVAAIVIAVLLASALFG